MYPLVFLHDRLYIIVESCKATVNGNCLLFQKKELEALIDSVYFCVLPFLEIGIAFINTKLFGLLLMQRKKAAFQVVVRVIATARNR